MINFLFDFNTDKSGQEYTIIVKKNRTKGPVGYRLLIILHRPTFKPFQANIG